MNENLQNETNLRYNTGYVVIMKIYHELELDRFFNNKARHETFKYNTNSIMQLLTITRILHPSSKKSSYEYKDRFFERFEFELYDMYRALSHCSKIGTECQRFISDQINEKYGRNTKLMYFDVTNFHFEIDETDNISDEIGKAFGIDFSKRRLRLNEIKNILASSKIRELY